MPDLVGRRYKEMGIESYKRQLAVHMKPGVSEVVWDTSRCGEGASCMVEQMEQRLLLVF